MPSQAPPRGRNRPKAQKLAAKPLGAAAGSGRSEGFCKSLFRFRLEQAGLQKGLPISPEAIALVYKLTRGYPRLMNILFDRTLREIHAQRKWGIDEGDVSRASEGMPAVDDSSYAKGAFGGKVGTLVKLVLVVALLVAAGGIGFWMRGRVPGESPSEPPVTTSGGGGVEKGVSSPWRVSVGEFDDKPRAQGAVRQALSRLRKGATDMERTGFVVTIRRGSIGERYRAVIGGFPQKAAAASAAAVLGQMGMEAVVHEGDVPTPR